MNKIDKTILILSQLASCIASGNMLIVKKVILKLKKINCQPLQIHETILQSYLFCGFPVVIETLKIFKIHYPKFTGSNSKYDVAKFKSEGNHICKLVYKDNFKKLIANMNNYSPDLKDWMIIEGYGKVMGRKGLSLLDRELINVSILTTRFYQHQLHSHLKGCLNLNASSDDLKQVLNTLEPFAGKGNVQKALKLLKNIIKRVI